MIVELAICCKGLFSNNEVLCPSLCPSRCRSVGSALPEQVGESRVAFAPDVVANTNSSTNGSANPVRSPSKSNMPAGWNLPNDWGFRFVVDSLRGVQYRVVRELELICRFGGGSGSSAAAAGSSVVSQSSATVSPRLTTAIL